MENGESSYRRFLAGDENGLVELVRDYKDGLIFYLNSFVRDLTVAEELAEDTFVRLGIRRPHFSGRSSFRTWLYAIGRNEAIDCLRRRSRSREVPEDECAALPDLETPETAYLREEKSRIVHRAMQRLRSEYRQILWLLYFENFSCREAAKVMKKSVHAVETLAYRARQALKSELLREGIQDEIL